MRSAKGRPRASAGPKRRGPRLAAGRPVGVSVAEQKAVSCNLGEERASGRPGNLRGPFCCGPFMPLLRSACEPTSALVPIPVLRRHDKRKDSRFLAVFPLTSRTVDFGGTDEQVLKSLDKGFNLCLKDKPIHSDKTTDLKYREKLVLTRKSAFPSLARLRPSVMLEDCTFPLSKISEGTLRIEKIPSIVNQEGLDMGNFGHIGDGNMHPTFVFDEKDEGQTAAFEKALDILYKDVVLPLGGSITAEHGIGLVKAPYIELEHGPSVKWMRAIKKLFDPQSILNPGKGKGGPYPIEAVSV